MHKANAICDGCGRRIRDKEEFLVIEETNSERYYCSECQDEHIPEGSVGQKEIYLVN
jgi:hypothetical protein